MMPDAMLQPPLPTNTCAIIVTYHPGEQLDDLIKCIAPQVARFIIVDNHSDDATITRLHELCAHYGGILLVNIENLGVASALNQGLRRAAQIEAIHWFLLFDQDTQPSIAFVAGMTAVWHSHPLPTSIGLIGCNYIDRMTGLSQTPVPMDSRQPWREVDFVITSGSALPRHVYEKVGDMCDLLFIDLVDVEYCLRVIANGYRIVKTHDPLIEHSVGAKTVHKLLHKTIITTNHTPARRYFMMRNSVLLAKEQLHIRPQWASRVLRWRFKDLVFVCLFEENRLAKISAILRGMWDGLFSLTHYNPLK
jgi:rhamnosyltransferase